MSDQLIRQFIRALRRASGYVQLYGFQHPLCSEAVDEASRAATDLIDRRPGLLMGISEDTLFIDGEASGLISLQFNSFLRDVAAAGITTLLMTPPVDAGEIAQLARLIAGDIEEDLHGRSIRVNTVDDFAMGGTADGPTAELRRSYAHSLDALRTFGRTIQAGKASSLDDTAAVVKDLLERSLANPAAALLLTTVKSHHEYTFYHSVNTSILSLGLARLAGLSEADQVVLGIGAMLHDIGKIGVSRAILQHPGRLDEEQWAEVRRHPQLGAEAILAAAAPGEELAAVVAFEHHARFDGSGYPRLVYHDGTHHHHDGHGHPMHFYSRLVAVADTYDAITTRRSYRRAEPPSRALQVLVSEAGASYDPDFVLAFASMMGIYPPGSFLRLTSGAVVMVTKPSDDPSVLPTAVIISDKGGASVAAPEPVSYGDTDIVEQVPASALGIEPAQILERIAVDG